MFGSTDDELLRGLVMSYYYDSERESIFLRVIRAQMKMMLKIRLEDLAKRIEKPLSGYDQKHLEELKMVRDGYLDGWKLYRFDLEGDEEGHYCRELVNQRRGK